MTTRLGTVAAAGIAGLLVTLPFAVLEFATYNPRFPLSEFPVQLFVALSIMAALASFGALSVVRIARAGQIKARVFSFALAVAGAGVMAWAWTDLVVDQMPCFLGGTGC